MVVELCFKEVYRLKSTISIVQRVVDSEKKERARLTTTKHLDVFFEREKGHMRKRDKPGKFYFLEGGRKSSARGR